MNYPYRTSKLLVMGLICILCVFAVITCSNNKLNLGMVNTGTGEKTGQANTGVITKPSGDYIEAGSNSNPVNKPALEEKPMFGEWEFVKVIAILVAMMVILTEVIGNIPVLSFLSKKLLSIAIMVGCIALYKIFSAHSWVYLFTMGGTGWYLGNRLWQDFVNGSFWTGWLKKK
ncbi:MAG: hypothetical protein V1701_02960 [Planctomycetota bacterium]